MSSNERTGWRDVWPSSHHRQLGRHMPQTDVDSLWYHYAEPVAVIDWKHHRSYWQPSRLDASGQAQLHLANRYRSTPHPNGLPFYVIIYWPDRLRWRWYALNDPARAFFHDGCDCHDGTPYLDTGETEFVRLAGRVRGLSDDQVADTLQHVWSQPLPGVCTLEGVSVSYRLEAQEQRQGHPWAN